MTTCAHVAGTARLILKLLYSFLKPPFLINEFVKKNSSKAWLPLKGKLFLSSLLVLFLYVSAPWERKLRFHFVERSHSSGRYFWDILFCKKWACFRGRYRGNKLTLTGGVVLNRFAEVPADHIQADWAVAAVECPWKVSPPATRLLREEVDLKSRLAFR